MSTSQIHVGRRYEDDGTFTPFKTGSGKRRVRYLTFTTHEGYVGKANHGPGARTTAYHAAMAEQARGRAEGSKLAAEVDAGIARHATACPKSPQLAPVVISPSVLATWLATAPAAALKAVEDALIAGLDRISVVNGTEARL